MTKELPSSHDKCHFSLLWTLFILFCFVDFDSTNLTINRSSFSFPFPHQDCPIVNKPDFIIPEISTVHFQYGHLPNITVGNHAYEKKGDFYTPLSVCQDFYRNGTIYPGNDTFEIDAHVETGEYVWLFDAWTSRILKYIYLLLICYCLFCVLLLVSTECFEVYPMYNPSLQETLPHFELHFKRFARNI